MPENTQLVNGLATGDYNVVIFNSKIWVLHSTLFCLLIMKYKEKLQNYKKAENKVTDVWVIFQHFHGNWGKASICYLQLTIFKFKKNIYIFLSNICSYFWYCAKTGHNCLIKNHENNTTVRSHMWADM